MKYLNPEDWDCEYEGRSPGDEDCLLGLADGAQVLGLQGVDDGVIPAKVKIKINFKYNLFIIK